ncbi:hypothetical protein QR680_017319 [Steinernema hermaphroditum]|uniref:Uncharacterized protein n=1 Tax=Steinernema hermaphroditum TaxID=289476 RepID=A0AA39LNX4_9BILA|nr:hypothetical protein QR680_017319 [Steinernema hermaphroditum]
MNAGAGATGPTLGNGTEGNLQTHAGALSSAYQMDSGAHNATLARAAGLGGYTGAPSTTSDGGNALDLSGASGAGAMDLSGDAGLSTGIAMYGNGTEGNLQTHAAALQSTYQLESEAHNAAYGCATY